MQDYRSLTERKFEQKSKNLTQKARSSSDAVRCPTETEKLRRFNQNELRGASAGLC